MNGAPVYVGEPTASSPGTAASSGFLDAQSALFHNSFPTYEAGLNLVLPVRNRAAQMAICDVTNEAAVNAWARRVSAAAR